ncbi:MAG: hypothetical protein H6811_04995 [Phycisphaeraceae bacterium]|nr:hypothetical protein [Phycisphaeraceae bacterium]
MKMKIALVSGCALGLAAAANGQTLKSKLGAAARPVASAQGVAGGASVARGPVVESLTYDGVATWASAGQDFESAFDAYDTEVLEDTNFAASNVTEFRSTCFGNGNPFGITDVNAELWTDNGSGFPGQGTYTGVQQAATAAGNGVYDGLDCITNFLGQAAGGGAGFVTWDASLNFTTFGQVYFFQQAGAHDNGGGLANNAWQWNPGGGFGQGTHFQVFASGGSTVAIGVNFILCGEQGGGCPDPNGCGDWDNSGGQADGTDFFAYLDSFANGDPCADLAAPAGLGGEDFFAYLDLFVIPCP